MIKKSIDLKLQITFTSPFIVGSGFGSAGVVDRRSIKDVGGIAYIPATSIKGKVKAELQKVMASLKYALCGPALGSGICKEDDLKNACLICRLFGSEFYEGSLIFADAKMDENIYSLLKRIEESKVIPVIQSSIRAGIKIDRRWRSAEAEALFTHEAVHPLSRYTSRIFGSAWLSDEEYGLFKSAIECITHLGGRKAGGLGRCKAEVNEVSIP